MLKNFQMLDFTPQKQPVYIDLRLNMKLEKKVTVTTLQSVSVGVQGLVDEGRNCSNGVRFWSWWTATSCQRGVTQTVCVWAGRGRPQSFLHAAGSWRFGRLQPITLPAERMIRSRRVNGTLDWEIWSFVCCCVFWCNFAFFREVTVESWKEMRGGCGYAVSILRSRLRSGSNDVQPRGKSKVFIPVLNGHIGRPSE